jgi:hypothetical protein
MEPQQPSRPQAPLPAAVPPADASADERPSVEDTSLQRREAEAPEPALQATHQRPSEGRTRRRWRTVLLVVLAVATVALIGGVVFGYVAYERVAEPDRSTPGVVVRQYIDATFAERDVARAARFTCTRPQIREIDELRALLVSREKEHNVTITVAPANSDVRASGSSATVDVDLKLTVGVAGASQREIQRWRFDVVQQNGWRVCDARRLA